MPEVRVSRPRPVRVVVPREEGMGRVRRLPRPRHDRIGVVVGEDVGEDDEGPGLEESEVVSSSGSAAASPPSSPGLSTPYVATSLQPAVSVGAPTSAAVVWGKVPWYMYALTAVVLGSVLFTGWSIYRKVVD